MTNDNNSVPSMLQNAQAKLINQSLDEGLSMALAEAAPKKGEGRMHEVFSFKIDDYTGLNFRKVQELMSPMYTDKSSVLRTLVGMAMDAILETQDEGEIGDMFYSIRQLREQNAILTTAHAKQELMDRVRRIGETVAKFRNSGELDEAVNVVRQIMSRVEAEPNDSRRKKQRRALCGDSSVYDAMREAKLDNMRGAKQIVTYMDKHRET